MKSCPPVNQQLEAKLHELEASNDDLRNLLASSDIATICLDMKFRIKWFSPATQKLFNFISSDLGRPISDLSPALGGAGLIDAAQDVLKKLVPAQHEFKTEQGRWFIRRALPYRTEEERIGGVIVTYTDITESHLARDALSDTRASLEKTHAQDLRERTDKLRALSAALAMAEERERRALAQDLHDDLGQLLAVVALNATE